MVGFCGRWPNWSRKQQGVKSNTSKIILEESEQNVGLKIFRSWDSAWKNNVNTDPDPNPPTVLLLLFDTQFESKLSTWVIASYCGNLTWRQLPDTHDSPTVSPLNCWLCFLTGWEAKHERSREVEATRTTRGFAWAECRTDPGHWRGNGKAAGGGACSGEPCARWSKPLFFFKNPSFSQQLRRSAQCVFNEVQQKRCHDLYTEHAQPPAREKMPPLNGRVCWNSQADDRNTWILPQTWDLGI